MVNGVRKKTAPVPTICNNREGNLLIDITRMATRCKMRRVDEWYQ